MSNERRPNPRLEAARERIVKAAEAARPKIAKAGESAAPRVEKAAKSAGSFLGVLREQAREAAKTFSEGLGTDEKKKDVRTIDADPTPESSEAPPAEPHSADPPRAESPPAEPPPAEPPRTRPRPRPGPN